MNWWGFALGVAGILSLVVLVYWQLIVAEGTYLGPRVVARTYDWISSRYDAIKQFDPRDESWYVARPLLHRLEGVDRPLILDVATGTGRLPLALFRHRFGGQIVGLDLSKGMLRQAWVKVRPYAGERVSFIWQDASVLPFEDGQFDAVVSLESLEFLPRPREALAEMIRVLAPGGVLFLTNRVGREARLLPGRAMPRPVFEQVLSGFPLVEVEIRRWQVSYDLAIARKQGVVDVEGRGNVALTQVLRCPACREALMRESPGMSCSTCGLAYSISEGIVDLARPIRDSN
jgi:ubiquinone/menaquinone biosynthesis C-methylase UbiE